MQQWLGVAAGLFFAFEHQVQRGLEGDAGRRVRAHGLIDRIAGILGGVVLIAVLWILFARGPDPRSDQALIEAQMDAATAQAQADSALIQGQVAGAQASVDIARADADRSQADAIRAASEARAAEARASTPVVIEREVQVPAPGGGVVVVTPTAPQG